MVWPTLGSRTAKNRTEHDMSIDLCGNGSSETKHDEDSKVGNNSMVDHRSRRPVLSLHCIIVSTDVMSDHIGCRDASCGGGCSKTSACTGQFGWASII